MQASPQISTAHLDQLVVAARDGNKVALARLLELLSECLWADMHSRRTMRPPGPSHGLSDLIQDTLTVVAEKFPRFKRDSFIEFKQWSYVILHRRRKQWIRNFLHRNDAARREQIGWVLRERLGRHGECVSDALQRRQEARRAQTIFESLDVNEQFVIRLRAVEDRRFAEIGRLTERSEGAACVAYRRAIRRLKKLFEAHEKH
ncbi:MAG TPA: sigma-70 family RNA polymerase sigma factor [Pirellulales bacterium]|nr:sigma-70 family RNA polymerase sigma factor [Pirellulales bacterium]